MRTEEMLALGMFGRGSRLGERVARLIDRGREFSPRVARVRVAFGGLALTACVIAGALAPKMVAFAEGQPRFEVTSVKENKSGEYKWSFQFPPGKYVARNVTVRHLIQNSYGIFEFQIDGATGWANSDRFDVEGTAQGGPTQAQVQLMVRSLLADRFKLNVHRETWQLPVYELATAKGGIKFKEGKCVGEPSRTNPCGGTFLSVRGDMRSREISVREFGNALSGYLGRTVVDKTGLTGKYDFDLQWTPDDTMPRGPGDAGATPPDPNGPSLFTAMQEQLGLELKAAKGPVEMLVIDHVERPDAN